MKFLELNALKISFRRVEQSVRDLVAVMRPRKTSSIRQARLRQC